MDTRNIIQLIRAYEVTEGAGVTVHRTLGTPALRNLDPFLMLDHFSSEDADEYIAGFPNHPHRGFVTLTYMLDGHMLHRDSMGNEGDLRTGGAQWMKAASGVIHSEMPKQTGGLMRGFQLWINLPAAHKMDEPAYQEILPESIPERHTAGARIRVLAGEHAGLRGPINDPLTELSYLDAALAPDAAFEHAGGEGHTAFAYVFEGDARVGDRPVPRHHFARLGPGKRVRAEAGPGGARLILISGRPIGEPIIQQGPFVMNTREEIEQAFADYREGRLVRHRVQTA